MLINQVDNYEIKNTSNSDKMGINVSKKAFEILSNGIYEEKIPSIIRELTSNAIDASNKANTKEPIVIYFPSNISEDFYIQDFGIGMSIETIIEVFANYFSSDKEQEARQIGGFGLGGKTPFIYSNIFKVETTSLEDDVRRTFIFSLQDNGPIYTHLFELDKKDCSIKGTKISFSIKNDNDVIEFIKGLKQMIYSSYPIDLQFNDSSKKDLYNIIGNDLAITEEITNEINKNKFCFFNKTGIDHIQNSHFFGEDNNNFVNIRLGDVMYQYEIIANSYEIYKIKFAFLFERIEQYFKNSVRDEVEEYINNDLQINLYKSFVFLDDQVNGNITVNTSREGINITKSNNEKIRLLLEDSINKFLINSINTVIKFIENFKIDENSLLFFAFYKKVISDCAYSLKEVNKELNKAIDDLINTFNMVFEPFLEIMNSPISLLTLNSKVITDNFNIIETTNDFDKLSTCITKPKFKQNITIGGRTLNEIVNDLYSKYDMYPNNFFNRNKYIKANTIANEYFNYIKIVKMDKSFNEYKITHFKEFIKSTKISLFDVNYKDKTNDINYIYFKNHNLKVSHYHLDEIIEINKSKTSKLNKTKQAKNKKNISNKMKICESVIEGFQKQYDYDVIKSMLLNNASHIVIPDLMYIKKTDNTFVKMFKKNLYTPDGITFVNYNILSLLTPLDVIVTSNEIYQQLIDNSIIENEIIDQLINKYKININLLINDMNNYVNNENPDLATKVLNIKDKVKRYYEQEIHDSRIFTKETLFLIIKKLNNEIMETLNVNDLCKIYITTNGYANRLEISDFDYKEKYNTIIDGVKNMPCYDVLHNYNYTNCIINDYKSYETAILNFSRLNAIKEISKTEELTIKNVRVALNKDTISFCENIDILQATQDFKNFVSDYFIFLSFNDLGIYGILLNYSKSNYIRYLKENLYKNNSITNNLIYQRVFDLAAELK